MNAYTPRKKENTSPTYRSADKVNMVALFLSLLLIPAAYFQLDAVWLVALASVLITATVLYNHRSLNALRSAQSKARHDNNQLEKRIAQDEILLKEIHHRVKNNLQTVSSLLSMQSRGVDDDNTRELLLSSKHRVISMALIHEMLYAYDDISKIQYQEYTEQLVSQLVRSVKGADNNIHLDIRMSDIKLGVNTAVPLGLLINEFITNTLKHGILGEEHGQITITLEKDSEDNFLLQLKDTGIGFSDAILTGKPNSLGLRLINNLVRQLRGQLIKEDSEIGVHFKVYFRESGAYKKKIIQPKKEALTA
ncbi:sensor histidine kinase [Robertkochia sediminum]|uniref:sensor histidine kinase n=1 Tax=Robertkochia sediminum TaxID=2785326 RepID=UPI001931C578|nr:sensor histidine kinase [Robertkochia sediminum]MBL7472624.1 sensor histidine kinase [Robertkochia sediminum]